MIKNMVSLYFIYIFNNKEEKRGKDMIKKDINEYCRENFIPEPYEYCDCTINKIDNLLSEHEDSFEDIWELINRYLINIFGVLCDKRLITETEFNILKYKLFELGDFCDKKYDMSTQISSLFRLIINKAEWYRIDNIYGKNDFFKGLPFKYLNWYDKPFESKWYIEITDEHKDWEKMIDREERTLEELTELIYILNNEMEKYDLEKEELYVIGGFACVKHGYKNLSEDIDNFTKSTFPPQINQLAREIGYKYISYPLWFSNLNSFTERGKWPSINEYLKIEGSFEEYLTLSKLKIYIQSPPCLLYTKLCSDRPKDFLDAKKIMDFHNLNTIEKVLNFINNYLDINFKTKEEIINNIQKILMQEY